MGKSLPIDSNSRPVPALKIGIGKTFIHGEVSEELSGHIVRFKAIGDSTFRLVGQPTSEIVMNDGDIEYFVIPKYDKLYIISGSINLMW